MQTSSPRAQANPTLRRVRAIGHLLDNAIAIPGTKYRVGIDPLLGLLPGSGDVVGTALSAYIVLEAARFGVPKSTIGRMVVNLIVDTFAGAVPVVGDVVDVAWKANSRNLALLESHIQKGEVQRKADRGFITLLAIGLLLFIFFVAAIVTFLVSSIWKLVFGG